VAEDVITTYQGQDITRRAQVLHEDGTLVLQGDLASVTARVFRTPSVTPEQVVPLIVQEVVYDTAQTEGWTGSDPGYNFKWTADGSYFSKGSQIYRVEISFRIYSTSGVSLDTPAYEVFHVKTKEILT
jgi:hypothetical protein